MNSNASPLCQAGAVVVAPCLVLLLSKAMARSKGDSSTSCSKKNDNLSGNNDNSSSSSSSSTQNRSSMHHQRRIQHILTGLLFYIISYILPSIICTILLSLFSFLFYVLHVYRSNPNYPQIQNWYLTTFGPLLRPHEKQIVRPVLPGSFWFLFGCATVSLCFPLNPIGRVALLCLSFGDPLAAIVGIYFTNSPKLRFRRKVSCPILDTNITARVSMKDEMNNGDDSNTSNENNNNEAENHLHKDHDSNWSEKSLAGCMACFSSSFCIAYFHFQSQQQMKNLSLLQNTRQIPCNYFPWDVSLITGLTATLMEALSGVDSIGGIDLNLDDNFLIPFGTSLVLYFYTNCFYS